MDVLDRTTRLDVVKGTSAPAAIGPSTTSAQDADGPCFADSLARPGRGATNGSGDESQKPNTGSLSSETSAPENVPPETAGSAASAVANDRRSSSATDKAPRLNDLQAAATTATDSADAYEESIQVLMAGLISAAVVAPPVSALVTGQEFPTSGPPASLTVALQKPLDIQAPPSNATEQQLLAPMPEIPYGLMCGMIYRGATVDAEQDASLIPEPHVATDTATNSSDQAATKVTVTPESIPDIPMSIAQLIPTPQPSTAVDPASLFHPTSGTISAAEVAVPSNDLSIPDVAPTIDPERTAARAVTDVPSKVQATNSQTAGHALQGYVSAAPQRDDRSRDLLDFATSPAMVPSVSANSIAQSANNSTINPRADLHQTKDNSAQLDGVFHSPASGPLTPQLGFEPAPVSTHLTETSRPSLSHATPNLVEQLQPLLHQAASQDRELSMTLRPPELGAVRIDVQHREGQMSARLLTETASAHQLLTEQLPQLRDVLTPMGIASDQIQVIRSEALFNSTPSGFATDRQTDAQQSGGRQDAPQQRAPEPQRIDDSERDDSQRPAILTRTALNLRI